MTCDIKIYVKNGNVICLLNCEPNSTAKIIKWYEDLTTDVISITDNKKRYFIPRIEISYILIEEN